MKVEITGKELFESYYNNHNWDCVSFYTKMIWNTFANRLNKLVAQKQQSITQTDEQVDNLQGLPVELLAS